MFYHWRVAVNVDSTPDIAENFDSLREELSQIGLIHTPEKDTPTSFAFVSSGRLSSVNEETMIHNLKYRINDALKKSGTVGQYHVTTTKWEG